MILDTNKFIDTYADSIRLAILAKNKQLTISKAPSPKFIVDGKEILCKSYKTNISLDTNHEDQVIQQEIYGLVADEIYDMIFKINAEKINLYILSLEIITSYHPIDSNDLDLHFEVFTPVVRLAIDYQ